MPNSSQSVNKTVHNQDRLPRISSDVLSEEHLPHMAQDGRIGPFWFRQRNNVAHRRTEKENRWRTASKWIQKQHNELKRKLNQGNNYSPSPSTEVVTRRREMVGSVGDSFKETQKGSVTLILYRGTSTSSAMTNSHIWANTAASALFSSRPPLTNV